MLKRFLFIFVTVAVLLIIFPINALGDSNFLGSGTQEDPYLIQSAEDLATLAGLVNVDSSTYADKFYRQTQDINLSQLTDWVPIGNLQSCAFAGTYDGSGNRITELNITLSTTEDNYTGLFGYVISGTIKNLHLSDGSINVDATGRPSIGSIVAYIENGTINNCSNDMDITITSNDNWAHAGGIAAHAYTNTVISECVNKGDINVSSDSWVRGAGGIVGSAKDNITITGCVNKGNIHSQGDVQSGGIAGFFETASSISSVSQCYNSGSVSAHVPNIAYIGGIIGYSNYNSVANCYNVGVVCIDIDEPDSPITQYCAGGIMGVASHSINKCYNAGQVKGEIFGGLAGIIDHSANYCYYADITSTGIGQGSTTATCVTLEEMKQQSTFSGFDFNTVWTLSMTEVTGYDLPQLQACSPLYVSQKSVNVTTDSVKGSVQGAGNYDLFDTVTITATPNEQYVFKNWEVVFGGAVFADPAAAVTTFVMHTTDVTVRGVFEEVKYDLVLQDNGHGSAESSGSYAWGDTVNITATADSGYQFMRWNVISGDIDISDAENMTASFVMPQSDVTIEAVFEIEPPGYTYTITNEKTTITDYNGSDVIVEIPSRLGGYPVKAINGAFSNNNTVLSVVVPDSVTDIGASAFSHCRSLEGIDLGNNVKSIGNNAFKECDSLISIDLGDSVESIGESAFYDCDSLTSIVHGNGVKSIGYSAFEYCESLTGVDLGDSVESIGNYAFDYCTSLTSIDLGNSVKSIGNGAFDNCKSLSSIDLGDSVESIGIHAFHLCESLTSLTLPDTLVSIGEHAFSGCESITGYHVASDNPNYKDIDGVLYNKAGTKLICYPAGVSGSYTIPAGVTEIEEYAFSDCDKLTGVVIPDTVTAIENGTFKSCDLLADIDLGEGIRTIGDDAIWDCDSLRSIEIPSSVVSIGDSGIYSCRQLVAVYFWGAKPTLGANVFADICLGPGFKVYYHISEAASWASYTKSKQSFCKLTKDLQDGQTPESIPAPLTNLKLSEPEDPVRAGYKFKAWYKEAECINEWDFETDNALDDIILYALWDFIGYNDAIIDGKLHRTYYNADESIDRIVIYYGADDTSMIKKISYYTDGIETSYRQYDIGGNLETYVELYSDGTTKKISYYDTTTGVQTSYGQYDTDGNLEIYVELYSNGTTKKISYYDTSTGQKTSYRQYDANGNLEIYVELYSNGNTKKISYYNTSTGVRISYRLYDTDGNLKHYVQLYTNGNTKKVSYYNTSTGIRTSYKLYDTQGRMTHLTTCHSNGVKPKKTSYYNVQTGERKSYKLYDTDGHTTHLITCHTDGVKPKKTNYYNVGTGVRKSYKLYDTQGRTTHYANCYSDGIKASKMNYYNVNTGKRSAYKTYRTDGSCSCYVKCDSNGNPSVATYYDKNGNVTKVIQY